MKLDGIHNERERNNDGCFWWYSGNGEDNRKEQTENV